MLANSLMIKRLSVLAFAVPLFALGGCANKAVGVYSGGEGLLKMTVDLKANGNAYFTTFAGTEQGTYTLDGDKVILTLGNGKTVFTLGADGSLKDGPFGGVLKRQAK